MRRFRGWIGSCLIGERSWSVRNYTTALGIYGMQPLLSVSHLAKKLQFLPGILHKNKPATSVFGALGLNYLMNNC